MDAFLKDVSYALRGLRRNPGFAVLAVLTLALGIGANTAIFSVVHGAVLKPLPYPTPARLVFITSQFPNLGFDQFWVSAPEYLEFRQHNESFKSVGAYRVGAVNLGTEVPTRPVSAVITEDLLPTLGVAPLRGRTFTREDTLPGAEDVAILSYDLWQTAFGGANAALGRVMAIDGVNTRIVGIMPRGFDVHDQKVEIWLPLTIDPANPGGRGSHFLYLVGRLKDDISIAQARSDLDRLLANWPVTVGGGAANHKPNTTTHRLRFDPLQDDVVGGARTAVWVLQAAVAFVLLIACANLASLLLARAETRQREFALRAALGAGRGRLLRQFIAEGLVLAFAGGVVGVVLAVVGLRTLLAGNADSIPRTAEIGVNGTVLVFTLGVAVLTGIVFGLIPLFRLSHRDLNGMLKEAGVRVSAGVSRRRARGVLVVAEIALAVVLVVGAGLMLRTLWNLLNVDAGFDRSRLVTFRIVLPQATYKAPERPAFFNRLLDHLQQVPGVQAAAVMNGLPPLRDVNANDTDFEDIVPSPQDQNQGPPENVDYWQIVSHRYVQTMGIPVVEGRSFEASDGQGTPVVMVNETLARTFFRDRSPIGRRLKPGFGDKIPWLTIVGVVKDVKQGGIAAKTGTELYLLADQLPVLGFGAANMHVVLRTALPPSSLAPTIQGIVRSMDAALPIVGLRTMDEVFVETVARPKFIALLLGIFAALALLLAAVGAYGVLSYLVTERRQEIGVRMALGADRGAVLAMVMRQGLMLTGIGLVAGLVGAVALTRLLESLLFGVRPADPATLVTGAVFMTLVSLAACFVPAHRATRVDPIVVLRTE
jgi:predicted permease